MTYKQLSEKLAELGVTESEPNIRNKLSRGHVQRGIFGPMSRSYGLTIFAVVGWLIVGSALAQAPSGQGVTGETPALEKQVPENAKPEVTQVDNFSIPVRIIEKPEDAERAKEREAKSDQHEADDLEAQRKAADAADRSAEVAEWQKIPTLVQMAFALFGTLGLIISLLINSKATRATVEMLRTKRAWILYDDIGVTHTTNVTFAGVMYPLGYLINVKLRNFGESPAMRVRLGGQGDWVNNADQPIAQIDQTALLGDSYIPQGAPLTGQPLVICGPDLAALLNNQGFFRVTMLAVYYDTIQPSLLRETHLVLHISCNGTTTSNGVTHPNFGATMLHPANKVT
ncbi:MAG: DUF6471 domain-containing protein [Aestuariivirga sp.]